MTISPKICVGTPCSPLGSPLALAYEPRYGLGAEHSLKNDSFVRKHVFKVSGGSAQSDCFEMGRDAGEEAKARSGKLIGS